MGSSSSFPRDGSIGLVDSMNALRADEAAPVSAGISQMTVDLVIRDLARLS
jgi:hypothetical protein